jgi:hypothetical protein
METTDRLKAYKRYAAEVIGRGEDPLLFSDFVECEENSERIGREISGVIERMKETYPDADDFHVPDDDSDTVEIYNAEGKTIATINTDRLTGYYNAVEAESEEEIAADPFS